MVFNDKETMVREITSRLVKAYSPREIYLFGSYAWGTPGKGSDIDFFVIVDKSDLDSAERIRLGLRELLDLKIAIDILVFTREEIDAKKNHPSTLAYKVLKRGVKLYEAA